MFKINFLFAYVRGEHVCDPVRGPLEGEAADEEDCQDDVGEEGGEVDDLPGGGDALADHHVHRQPGYGQGEKHPPVITRSIF